MPDALFRGDAPARPAGTGPRGIEAVCGTRLEAAAEMVAQHAARELHAPLPTPHSTDVGEIAVLEDDGNFFYSNPGGKVVADLAAIGQSFYRTHGDDYDCLAVVLSSGLTTWLGSASAIAAAFVVRNDIQGIGIDPYDVGSNMGSAARLEWMLSLNGLHRFPADPYADISGDTFSTLDVIAHEFGHRWLSYTFIDSAGTPSDALLGRANQHWSFYFDSDASLMEGGNWVSPSPDSFTVDGLSNGFGNLDLYLMGLRSGAQTDSFFTLHDATDYKPPGAYNETSWATIGTSCDARRHYWKVADLEALNGPRVPDAASAPHVFRMGVVLVTARGLDATPQDLAELENLRTLFTSYFATASQGLGAVDASLDSRAGDVRIEHDLLADRLDLAAPVTVAAKITIAQAGIPLAVDAGSLTLYWRLGAAGPFSSVPLTPAGADSFAANLPPSPGYTGPVQYYLYAASDSAGIDEFDPPAGAAAPHEFAVGPDMLAPTIVHTPILAQGEGRMPVTLLARVTDNVGLQSVLLEWGIDAPSGNSVPMAPVGRDSFALTVGSGLMNGQTLQYQIVARDHSNNVRFHRSALSGNPPWTLSVGEDWIFDTENGAGELVHARDVFSYRDAWHTTQESSSPPGGTAWKCGDIAPLPYPVHVDANLYSPWIPSVEPGTVLRFQHRYELEEANSFYAWDGARVEAQVSGGPWLPVTPQTPYSHAYLLNSLPFQRNTPCWSGFSGGRREEVLDLSALAPGPARFRFRMLADDFAGYDGWLVDSIRVDFPGDVTAVGDPGPAAQPAPWPNPATHRLHVQLSLPRAGAVDWTLFDLAGRRVAMLTQGEFAAGRVVLEAALPKALRPGLYLARLRGAGMAERVDRIAVIR
ncbi:MAG: hypothetical protein ABIS67_05300 [Candidatus Eisenbacteria bacterium]